MKRSRLVVVALLPILLGALLVHAPNGWAFTAANGGWEYPAFLVVAAAVQAMIGDGAYALRPVSLTRLQSAKSFSKTA